MTALALAIAVKGAWNAERLLQDLLLAGLDDSTEVHVACDPEHEQASSAMLTIHSRAHASLFELWDLAIAASKAPWVAILHADGVPAPGWFAAMEAAIDREGWPDGYWGPVEPPFAGADRRMIGYLTEYAQFHRPLDPKLSEVPGSNLVIPRARIEASRTAQGNAFSKTRLLEQGLAPKPVEDAVVHYSRRLAFADYCGRRFRHGRAYAAGRTARFTRPILIVLTAALPLVRAARVARHAWRHQALRLPALYWLPAVLLAETCWSAGEFIGYVTRRGGNLSALD